METAKELNNRKVSIVTLDESLEKFRDKTICPDKLNKANQMLKTAKLPKNRHRS